MFVVFWKIRAAAVGLGNSWQRGTDNPHDVVFWRIRGARRDASLDTDRERVLALKFCDISRYEVRTLPKGIEVCF